MVSSINRYETGAANLIFTHRLQFFDAIILQNNCGKEVLDLPLGQRIIRHFSSHPRHTPPNTVHSRATSNRSLCKQWQFSFNLRVKSITQIFNSVQAIFSNKESKVELFPFKWRFLKVFYKIANMNWFSGNIAEAVALSKSKNSIFVVYCEGNLYECPMNKR